MLEVIKQVEMLCPMLQLFGNIQMIMLKEKIEIVNQNDLTFNDLNKWSPADIYLVSQKGKMVMRQLASTEVLYLEG